MFSEKKKKLGNQQLWSTQIFPGLSSMEHRNGQIWKLIWMHSHRIKKKNLFCYWLFLAKFNSRVWFLQATAAIYSSTQKVAHKQQHSKVSHVIPQLQRGWECLLASIQLHLPASQEGLSREYRVVFDVSEVPMSNHPMRINLVSYTSKLPSKHYVDDNFGHFFFFFQPKLKEMTVKA